MTDWGSVDLTQRAAALGLGYPWSDDSNAPDSTGASPFAVNSRANVRVSTADGCLDPARGRPNLTLLTDCRVVRVLVDGR